MHAVLGSRRTATSCHLHQREMHVNLQTQSAAHLTTNTVGVMLHKISVWVCARVCVCVANVIFKTDRWPIFTKLTVIVTPMTEWRKSDVAPFNFLHKQQQDGSRVKLWGGSDNNSNCWVLKWRNQQRLRKYATLITATVLENVDYVQDRQASHLRLWSF
jgi:hypothetical protein